MSETGLVVFFGIRLFFFFFFFFFLLFDLRFFPFSPSVLLFLFLFQSIFMSFSFIT